MRGTRVRLELEESAGKTKKDLWSPGAATRPDSFPFFVCLAGHRSSLPCLRSALSRHILAPLRYSTTLHYGTPALNRFSCQTGKKIS
jgi:hypothetical protein